MTGTWSSSANRVSSVEVLARSTPPPARMTGRSADARNSMTARISSSVARAAAGPGAVGLGVVGHRFVEEVLRQREQDGARTATERLPTSPPRSSRRRRRPIARLGGPLGEAAERRDLVDLLERLAAQQARARPGRRHEHRRGVLARRVDADGEVRGADRARPERDRGSAGQLAMGLGHERRGTLVPRRDDPDPGALEGVEQAQERLTRAP